MKTPCYFAYGWLRRKNRRKCESPRFIGSKQRFQHHLVEPADNTLPSGINLKLLNVFHSSHGLFAIGLATVWCLVRTTQESTVIGHVKQSISPSSLKSCVVAMKKFGLGAKNMDVEWHQNRVLTNHMSSFMRQNVFTHIKTGLQFQSCGLHDLQMAAD